MYVPCRLWCIDELIKRQVIQAISSPKVPTVASAQDLLEVDMFLDRLVATAAQSGSRTAGTAAGDRARTSQKGADL
jgi:hypothetical protein